MRTRHYCWSGSTPAPRSDNVSDGVNADLQPQLTHPVTDQITTGLVCIRKRKPSATAPLNRTNFGKASDAPMQPFTVDFECFFHHLWLIFKKFDPTENEMFL